MFRRQSEDFRTLPADCNRRPTLLVTVVVVLIIFYSLPLLSVAWFIGVTVVTAFIAWATSWPFPMTLIGFPVFLFIWFILTCIFMHLLHRVMLMRR